MGVMEQQVAARSPLIALLGNPNCGKTALFNLLTGSRQKVANFAGVTALFNGTDGYATTDGVADAMRIMARVTRRDFRPDPSILYRKGTRFRISTEPVINVSAGGGLLPCVLAEPVE